MYDYEEACPVSKAASILCERWTLQILREMCFGACRFSELQAYLPRMSPTLLNSRLRVLEEKGLLMRRRIPGKKGYEYLLTPMGQGVLPIIREMGKWGMGWHFQCLDERQLNLAAIIRDFACSLRHEELPRGSLVFRFTVTGEGEEIHRYVTVRGGTAQVCDDHAGLDVDFYLSADLGTWGRLWYGEISIPDALRRGLLKTVGHSQLQKTLPRWLGTSQFVPYRAVVTGER